MRQFFVIGRVRRERLQYDVVLSEAEARYAALKVCTSFLVAPLQLDSLCLRGASQAHRPHRSRRARISQGFGS